MREFISRPCPKSPDHAAFARPFEGEALPSFSGFQSKNPRHLRHQRLDFLRMQCCPNHATHSTENGKQLISRPS